ncbi:MAG: flagellar motor protein MotB [Pseudomonadota bacterium]
MAIAYSSRRNKGRKPAASARKLGNWKLAYADFLTALCAFFLIMWIIQGVSSEERQALAQQFGSDAQKTEPAPIEVEAPSAQLADALRDNPDLASFKSSLTITSEPHLIRIDLSDMAERPLFDTGDGRMNATGEQLTRLVGNAISPLPLQVMIEGHTDSHPSRRPGYSNWELSSDRANSARRLLLQAGVKDERIQGVAGLAHTRPLLQETPEDPANRRISIVLVIPPKSA